MTAGLEARWRAETSVDEALLDALAAAAQAPSSHNSQPWAVARLTTARARRWVVELTQLDISAAAQVVVVCLDHGRALRALSAHQLEMKLSCGAYLQALMQRLDDHGCPVALGWPGRTAMLPLAHRSGPWEVLAALAVNAPRPSTSALPAHAPRMTNRAAYRSTAVPAAALDRLRRLSVRLAPAPALESAVRVDFIDDPLVIRRAGALVGRHAARDFSHRAAWRETHSFIRFRADDIRHATTGMSLSQLFGPLPGHRRMLYRCLLAPSVMSVLRWLGLPRILGMRLGRLVTQAPLLVALSFRRGEPGSVEALVGGAAMLDLWHKAADQGLALHPISVVLQHEAVRHLLQDELGLNGRTFFFCRVGYPTASFPPAPRRPLHCPPLEEITAAFDNGDPARSSPPPPPRPPGPCW